MGRKLLKILKINKCKRLFVDIDGTLCEWRKSVSHEELLEKNYFYNLKPQIAIIKEVKKIIKNSEIKVYVLSAILPDSEHAIDDKNKWLDKYLPEVGQSNRLFSLCGQDKTTVVPGGVDKDDFLLDDYSVNLRQWSKKGTAIKVLNGQNGRYGTWTGLKIKA